MIEILQSQELAQMGKYLVIGAAVTFVVAAFSHLWFGDGRYDRD